MERLAPEFTEEVVGHWGIWEGIRELVQNALDEMLDYERVPGYENVYRVKQGKIVYKKETPTKLVIRDYGRGITVESLTKVGVSRKKPAGRGRFGEGTKYGVIALLREGCKVTFESPIIGKIEGKLVGKKPRTFVWEVVSKKTRIKKGTKVTVEGAVNVPDDRFIGVTFSPRVVAKSKTVKNHYKVDEEGFIVAYPWERDYGTAPGKIFVVETVDTMVDYPNKIYVRDIYVADTPKKSLYSYNIWRELPPNVFHRDRSFMNYQEFRVYATGIWLNCSDARAIKRFFKTVIVDKAKVFESDLMFERNEPYHADVWRKAIRSVVGKDTVLYVPYYNHSPELVKMFGYKPVAIPANLRGIYFTYDKTYSWLVEKHKSEMRKIIPDHELSETELKKLNILREIAKFVHENFYEKIAEVARKDPFYYDAPNFMDEIVAADFLEEAKKKIAGEHLSHREGRKILIWYEYLTEKKPLYEAIRVLVHELAHHYFGVYDESISDMRLALEYLSAFALEYIYSKL